MQTSKQAYTKKSQISANEQLKYQYFYGEDEKLITISELITFYHNKWIFPTVI
jgi:hypothetical protein